MTTGSLWKLMRSKLRSPFVNILLEILNTFDWSLAPSSLTESNMFDRIGDSQLFKMTLQLWWRHILLEAIVAFLLFKSSKNRLCWPDSRSFLSFMNLSGTIYTDQLNHVASLQPTFWCGCPELNIQKLLCDSITRQMVNLVRSSLICWLVCLFVSFNCCSFVRLFVRSFGRSFVRLLVRLFVRTFVRSLVCKQIQRRRHRHRQLQRHRQKRNRRRERRQRRRL